MGRKNRHCKRHGRGRARNRSRYTKADKARARKANAAFYEAYRAIRAGGEPIDDDEIGATAPHDTTDTGGKKS